MNPQQEQQTQAPAKTIDPNLLAQIIGQTVEQYESSARPFGKEEDYSEEDAKELGLPSPKSLNFLMKYVRRLIGTPIVPRWMYDCAKDARSDEERIRIIAGTMLATVVRGREMGFKAMESTEIFYRAPDGRLGMYAKPMTALMLRHGAKLDHTIDTDEEHELKGTRTDGNQYVSRFTQDDAKRAGLTAKDYSNHNKYPRRMLKWRCLSDMFNTLFPDVTGTASAVYTAEELIEEIQQERNGGAAQPQPENPFKVSPKPQPVAEPEKSNLENQNQSASAPKDPPVTVTDVSVTATVAPVAPITTSAPVADAARSQAARQSTQGRAGAASQTGARDEARAHANRAAGEFKASDDDLPKEFVSKPVAAEPVQEIPQDQRFVILMGKLAAHMGKPVPECRAVRDEFLRSFMGHSGPLPKPPSDKYVMVLPWLEAIIEHKCDSLVNDPHALGLNVVAGVGQFVRFIDAWQAETKAIATKAALSRCPHTGGKDLIGWLEMVQADGPLSPADLRVALRVFGISGAATSAVLDAAQSRGVTLAAVVGDLDLSTATEGQVLTAVASGAKQAPAANASLWED